MPENKLDVLFKSLDRKEVAKLLADTKDTFFGIERIVLSKNQHEDYIKKLELFLDFNAPTWRSEIERENKEKKG